MTRVGMIGLGAMGAPMAGRLLEAGHDLVVYDLNDDAVRRLVDAGAEAAAGPGDVLIRSKTVVTMVTDDAALTAIVFGDDGFASVDGAGRDLVDISSTSLTLTRRIAEWATSCGVAYADAAVINGGPAGALRGDSPIVVSGDDVLVARLGLVLASLGRWLPVGQIGGAKITKIVNNWLVGALTASNAEGLALGTAQGVELATLYAALMDGSGESTVLRNYVGARLETGSYPDGLISMPMMEKDLALAIQLGDEVDAPVISAEISREIYRLAGGEVGRERSFPWVTEFFAQRDPSHQEQERS